MNDPVRADVHEWSPAPALVVLAWLLAAAGAAWFAALWWIGADPAGRLMAAVLAVGATLVALFGTRARPRLRADPAGITVTGLLRAVHHPWPFVTEIRVSRVRRLGRDTSVLEIETCTVAAGEQLLVLGRLDLAADPEDVAPQLRALRP